MNYQKEVTIYDIAKALKVSPATVSRGLNDHPGIRKDTKKRIVETAQSLGYQRNTFATRLRVIKTHTIGVVIPRLNSYFMSAVIAGMENVANDRGYQLIISQSQESVKKEIPLVDTMFNSRVDGLLVSLAYDTENIEHFNHVFKKNIPVIFFDRVAEHTNCTSVIIDNTKAGYDATAHLLEQGCKRIVFIGGDQRRNVYSDRLKGYQMALREKGMAYDPSLTLINNLSEQAAEAAARQIMKMNPLPDGIFACNDTSAVACIGELKHGGIKVPDQIAVVGFNNDPISRVVEPNLTTIHYPGHEMGEITATTLINTLNKLPVENLNTLILRHNLIVRLSSLKKK